jgi:hypothetical protein
MVESSSPLDIPQPKILLEGTHLTRKTDVAFALAEHRDIIGERKRRWHIPLLSSEWETRSDRRQTKDDPGWSMITYPPRDEAWALECYETYTRLLELNRDYYWVLDRFHISTISHQRLVHDRDVDLDWVDRRLAALGFVLVHLQREPDTFAAARDHRLTYSENPTRYNNLDKFVAEQEMMAELVGDSAIRSRTVDVSDGDVDRVAAEIVEWIRDSGAFWGQ